MLDLIDENKPIPRRLLNEGGPTTTVYHLSTQSNGTIATFAGYDQSVSATIQATENSVSHSQRHVQQLSTGPMSMTKQLRNKAGLAAYGDSGLPRAPEDKEGSTRSLYNLELQDKEGTPPPVLRLRGGADADGGNGRKSKRLGDDEHVPRLIWYFSGGTGSPPTGKQLRDRRQKEREYVQRKEAEAQAKKEERKAEW